MVIIMANKTFCTTCGLMHHPPGCKKDSSDKKKLNREIDALNILSVTNVNNA